MLPWPSTLLSLSLRSLSSWATATRLSLMNLTLGVKNGLAQNTRTGS